MNVLRAIFDLILSEVSKPRKKPVEAVLEAPERYLVSNSFPQVARSMQLTQSVTTNLMKVEKHLLDPLEREFGRMEILSGYRDVVLNGLIGGSKSSDHMIGAAIDFYSPEIIMEDLFYWIIASELPYRQVIWYPEQNFIHISVNTEEKKFKMQALIKKEDGYEEV